MSRRTKEEAEKTRKRILASALALFVRKGYDHTTFTDIAARLKLTKGAVYWHFASKVDLLVALVDEMSAKFRRQLEGLMPRNRLEFEAVAEMMVADAKLVTEDPKGRAFFLLMSTQVRWGSESMARVREELINDRRFGPYHAFRTAIENGRREGRVSAEINAEEIALGCVTLWDGLVRTCIDGFISREQLEHSLRRFFKMISKTISKEKRK